MDKEIDILIKRLNEAIKIIGTQKKLCDISGVSPVILSRFKGYHRGTNYIDKRYMLSMKTLTKLADAIGEDVSFFTDENYTRKKDRNNAIIIDDNELKPILERFIKIYNESNIKDKGFLQGKIEQVLIEHEELTKKRVKSNDRKAKTA